MKCVSTEISGNAGEIIQEIYFDDPHDSDDDERKKISEKMNKQIIQIFTYDEKGSKYQAKSIPTFEKLRLIPKA